MPHVSTHILTGHISSTVWRLTWPSVIALLLQTLSNNVDRGMVARLGGDQVAALGLAQNLTMLVFGSVVAISAATTALVARAVGAANWREAEEATRQSLYFALFASVTIILLTLPVARPILTLMAGKATAIVEPSIGYLRIALVGLIPLFAMTIMIAAFRGVGDMLTPVKLTLTAAVLAASLDWVLIYGHLGFPAMGLPGAAWASVTARSAAVLLGGAYLFRSSLGRSLSRVRPMSATWLARILNLGVPAGMQSILRTGASMVYFSFLGRLSEGKAAMASLTVGLGIESLAFMPGFAFSAAAAAMVGQNLGAREPDRAAASGWACAKQAAVVMTVMAGLFYLLAPQIVSLFTKDPEIHHLTVAYLRINALSEPFLALGMTLSGALQGAGDTRSPTVVTFMVMWVGRLPLTYWLAVDRGYGPIAAWWTMSGSAIISGILISIVFASGRWRDIKI